MGSSEDVTIRELELKALRNEGEWYVNTEIPKMGRKLKRILQHCLAFLGTRGSKELELLPDLVPQDNDDDVDIPPLDNANKLVSFDTPDGVLKGFIGVGGWSIATADLTVKFPKFNKGAPYKATVSATHPWRLVQLQNAYNFVKMTLNELDLLLQLCTSPPPTNSQFRLPLQHSPSSTSILSLTPQPTISAVNKLVGQVSKWMALARDSLMIPNKSLTFPNTLSNTGFQGFHPPLPQDLHIEFSVCNAEVIISVYALHIGSGPVATSDSLSPLRPVLSAGSLSSPSSHHRLSLSSLKPGSHSSPSSPTSSSSSLSLPGSGMKHKTPSVGNLLNLPSTFSFSQLQLTSSSVPAKIQEEPNENGQEIIDSPPPTISVVSSMANQPQSPSTVLINGTTYKTYQVMQRGAPAWAAVVDQVEVHCIVPRMNHTISLILSAIDVVADVEDKLVALSLL